MARYVQKGIVGIASGLLQVVILTPRNKEWAKYAAHGAAFVVQPFPHDGCL